MPESACVKRGNRPNHKARKAAYKAGNRREVNKAYRLIRHLERVPADAIARKALARCVGIYHGAERLARERLAAARAH